MRYDTFISYRRDGGSDMAMSVKQALDKRGFSPFMDVDGLKSGKFNIQLYERIAECDNFILILPSKALDRCVNEGDWLRLEIAEALRLEQTKKMSIVPLIMNGFKFPDNLPDDIKEIEKFQGLPANNDLFEARMDKLAAMLIGGKKPFIQQPTNRDAEYREDIIRVNNYSIFEDFAEAEKILDSMFNKYIADREKVVEILIFKLYIQTKNLTAFEKEKATFENLNKFIKAYKIKLDRNERYVKYLEAKRISEEDNEFFNHCIYSNSEIKKFTFYGKETLRIPSGVTKISENTFSDCVGLTSITIPSSVTSIGDRAFSDCTGLTSVTIPSSVTSIGKGAFYGCTGLTSVTMSSGVMIIDDNAFSGCTGLSSVIIPSSVTSICNAFSDCTGLTSVTIPSSVTSIDIGAFYGCTGLTSVTIPSSVTSIGGFAFHGCSELTSITIPSSVISIGHYAFCGCTGLTSVTMSSGVMVINDNIFYGCTGLTSVTIPSSVMSIGFGAFSDCIGLTSVTIPSSVTSICNNAFAGCTGLTSVTIPSSVTSIGFFAFACCAGLTSVTIASGVTSIGGFAFAGCKSLTSVTIPSSVTKIGDYAFELCSGLNDIMVDKGNRIYHSANNCIIETSSKQLIIGCKNSVIPSDGSVNSIYNDAFSGCKGLTSVTIPSSVTSIGENAFCNCSQLKIMIFEGSQEAWDAIKKGSGWNDGTSFEVIFKE